MSCLWSRLSTAVLLLTSAAYAAPFDLEERQGRARTLIDPSTYPILVRYGEFAAASIPKTCAVPPDNSTVLEYINIVATDTQATVFRADNTKEIIVSYGGSSSLQDFVTDFTFIPVSYSGCSNCSVHVGFYTAWKSISSATTNAITKALAANPSYSVTITGHSLGGAIVSLAYAALKSDPKYKVTQALSFGEPRVGNPSYANFVDRLSGASDSNIGTYRRVTHANDGVPNLPPQYYGFQHSRTEIWANDGSNGKPSAQTTYRCYGQEAPDCNLDQGGVGINMAHVYYPGVDYGTACGTGVVGGFLPTR